MGRSRELSPAQVKKLRRDVINKNRNQLAYTLDKPIVSLFSYRNTVIPSVIWRIELWFFTILHVVLFVLKDQGVPGFFLSASGASVIDTSQWSIVLRFSAVSIPSGLMALLLVFFNNQCYSRYTQLYSACTAMGGALQELGQMTAVHMSHSPEDRWSTCRYALASIMVTYLKVVDLAKGSPMRIDGEDWERMLLAEEEWLGQEGSDMNMPPLLSSEEVTFLKGCPGKETQVLQTWALDTAFRAYQRSGADGHSGTHGHHFQSVQQSIIDLRRASATIPNLIDNPIPFPYYHVMVTLMFLNFFLYSVAFLELDSVLTPVAMFMVVFITTGIRELSSALANPFGSDDVDFNTSKFMHKLRGITTFMCSLPSWEPPGQSADELAHEDGYHTNYDAKPAEQHNESAPGQHLTLVPATMETVSNLRESEREQLEAQLAAQAQQMATLQAQIQQAEASMGVGTTPGPSLHADDPWIGRPNLVTAPDERMAVRPPTHLRPIQQLQRAQVAPSTQPPQACARPNVPTAATAPLYAPYSNDNGVPRWRPVSHARQPPSLAGAHGR